MGFVMLRFPERRRAHVDGVKAGYTNEVLNIDRGMHVFAVDGDDYRPVELKVMVQGTSPTEPLVIEFFRKDEESGSPASKASAGRKQESPSPAVESASSSPPPHAPGAAYDQELRTLIRVAAMAGSTKGLQRAVNYTTLLIGFAFCVDTAPRFLQVHPGWQRKELLASRDLTPESNNEMRFVHEAENNFSLPADASMYSGSAIRMLELARDIAVRVGADGTVLGPRHLLAAYLFATPSEHVEDLRRWGLAEPRVGRDFLSFAVSQWTSEGWRQLDASGGAADEPQAQAVAATLERALYVATFGSDDPSRERRDLLDAKYEARAFARIAASRDTRLPLSVGVFGEWGAGKTFFMGVMSDEVERLSKGAEKEGEPSLFLPDIVQIKFNAWHYIETNLWASLVEYIFSELDRSLRRNRTPEEEQEVERLFEQLSTSRLLKLEAIEDLIVKRDERKKAQEEVERARADYERALLRQPALTSSDFWSTVLEAFKQELRGDDATRKEADRLEGLAGALGLKDLKKSAGALNEILKEAQTEVGRARVLNRAMVAKLGQWRWIAAAVLALLVIPGSVLLLKDWLADFRFTAWVGRMNEAVLALSGLLASAGVLAGNAVHSARSALTRLEGVRDKLGKAVNDRIKAEMSVQSGKFAEAERDISKKKNELEQAERKFAEADKRSDEVLRGYKDATARGRLNAFIRDKLASGDYAKHLGLIATIRRDFEQLAQLMADAENDKKSRDEYRRAEEEYQQRLDKLIARAKKMEGLTEKELKELEMKDNTPQPRLFTRIVLYIDDLDRCPSDKVVDVLQAIHLLLYFPLFVVVVAVDARWVSRSLREQFPQLLTENIITARPKGADHPEQKADDKRNTELPAAATSHDYLEKIFQIPYWVRPMDAQASKKYVKGIAGTDFRGAKDIGVPKPENAEAPSPAGTAAQAGTPALAAGPTPVAGSATKLSEAPQYVTRSMTLEQEEQDCLEAFAPYVGGTPRRGLRFVNIYRLVKTSLSEELQKELITEKGGRLASRALITQLAIVTGAPHLAASYFQILASSPPEETLASLRTRVENELSKIPSGGQKQALLGALDCLAQLNQQTNLDTGKFLLRELGRFAPMARRYSFTARPH